MLRALDIRDILIIDHLELAFQPGLNVLTGETGAGKSILLDSLGFVLGWRGRAELVRQGADQGEVMAEFDLPEGHPARDVLQEAGLPAGDELILRRVNSRDGRKTAWVNDRRCSGEVLRRLSETLVELHGQHDDRGLLDPKGHRALLDAYGRLEPLKTKARSTWRGVAEARKALETATAALDEVRAEEPELPMEIAAQKVHAGGRPSTFLHAPELTPYRLGSLIALFEHRTYLAGVLWGVNSFDQWGVERGKTMAGRLKDALGGKAEANDPVTAALMAQLKG